jgi:hypothetical protein
MPAKRTVLAPIQPRPQVVSMVPQEAESKGEALVKPLNLGLVLIINNQEDYESADRDLGKVRLARKKWKELMYGPDKDHPGPIPLQYASLESLYALNRKFDQPMEAKEKEIKTAMSDFNTKKLREAQVAEEQRLAAERKLAAERAELERKMAQAQTPKLVERLAKQVDAVAVKQAEIEQPINPSFGIGIHSATRRQKKWEIDNPIAFVNAIAEGTFPASYFQLSPEGKKALDEQLKTDPDALAAYPGVRVYEDSGIVGR